MGPGGLTPIYATLSQDLPLTVPDGETVEATLVLPAGAYIVAQEITTGGGTAESLGVDATADSDPLNDFASWSVLLQSSVPPNNSTSGGLMNGVPALIRTEAVTVTITLAAAGGDIVIESYVLTAIPLSTVNIDPPSYITKDTGTDTVDIDAAHVTVRGGAIGPTYQVFEVADLEIPAGTDWSDPHVLDTTEMEASRFFLLALWLELDVEPDVAVECGVTAGGGFVTVAAAQIGPGAAEPYAVSATTTFGAAFNQGSGADTSPVPMEIVLTTGGETAIDITVVKARAAFLIV